VTSPSLFDEHSGYEQHNEYGKDVGPREVTYVAIHTSSPLPSYRTFGQLRWVVCASMFAGRNVILTVYPPERKFIW
jgi:hypothetical protein